MKFAPGGVPWLVIFDLRLALDRFGRVLTFKRVELNWRQLLRELVIMLLLLHVLGLLLVIGLRMVTIPESGQLMILSLLVVLAWLVSFGSAAYLATAVLFLRGDMDLLCSSPLPTRTVFTARALSIGLQSCLWPAFLTLPAADVALVFGDPRWLAAYPVVLALGLSAGAAGLLFAVALVRIFGARRARMMAVLASALFGASWFVVLEMPALLGNARFNGVYAGAAAWFQSTALSAPHSILWYPARAVQGELLPLVAVVCSGLAVFWLISRWLPRGFLFAMQRAADVPVAQTHRRAGSLRFHRHFGMILFLKEWRLILRDPWLLGRLARMLLMLAVAAAVLANNPSFGHVAAPSRRAAMVAAFAVFLAVSLADMFAWLAICAEDLPDLILSAPRRALQVLGLKLVAMLAPVWVLALVAALALVEFSPWGALWMAVAVAGATTSAALVHFLNPMHASRKDLMRRMRVTEGMPITRLLLSMLNLLGWAAVAYCFPAGYWLAGLVVLVVVGALTSNRVVRGWRRLRRAEWAG